MRGNSGKSAAHRLRAARFQTAAIITLSFCTLAGRIAFPVQFRLEKGQQFQRAGAEEVVGHGLIGGAQSAQAANQRARGKMQFAGDVCQRGQGALALGGATVAFGSPHDALRAGIATAAARLGRVAGVRVTRKGSEYAAAIRSGAISEDDLADALAACPSPLKPADTAMLAHAAGQLGDGPEPSALPTVADLAAQVTGIDWPALIDKCIDRCKNGFA